MPGPKNKNLFFPFTLEELKEIEEEEADIDEQERHLLTFRYKPLPNFVWEG
jgi:hypothetical protein